MKIDAIKSIVLTMINIELDEKIMDLSNPVPSSEIDRYIMFKKMKTLQKVLLNHC